MIFLRFLKTTVIENGRAENIPSKNRLYFDSLRFGGMRKSFSVLSFSLVRMRPHFPLIHSYEFDGTRVAEYKSTHV
jgi:hypothetical protein